MIEIVIFIYFRMIIGTHWQMNLIKFEHDSVGAIV